MDIGTAIGKPFNNIANLVIGIVLTIIPILNIITIPGYLLRVAKRTMNKDKSLPGFENFGEIIVDSLKAIVVGIVYLIIFIIIAFILALIPIVGLWLVLLADIVFLFVMMSAMMTLAKTGSIGSALGIPEVFNRAKNGGFIAAVIVGSVISGIIALIVLVIVAMLVGAPLLPLIMSGTTDPIAIGTAIAGMISGFIIGGIILVIVVYILDIFCITLVAEAYPGQGTAKGGKTAQM